MLSDKMCINQSIGNVEDSDDQMSITGDDISHLSEISYS